MSDDLKTMKAKPLVWDGAEKDCYIDCKVDAGVYGVGVLDSLERPCDYIWYAEYTSHGTTRAISIGSGTFEEAKATAQTHRNNHVCSLFEEEAIAAWNIRALPALDTAAIREAAWVDALDAAHEYTLTQYGMGFLKHPVDRERILALIGEKK
jgi:hypothetical protein